MQCLLGAQLVRDFPTLRFVLPHGGGAVPYHWGRYRGMALDLGLPELDDLLLNNIFFDTCVYHQRGIDLLFDVVRHDNLVFASEMLGAVRAGNPRTAASSTTRAPMSSRCSCPTRIASAFLATPAACIRDSTRLNVTFGNE